VIVMRIAPSPRPALRGVRLLPALPAALLTHSAGPAAAQTMDGPSVLSFVLVMPSNSEFLMLVLILLGLPVLGYIVYRILLKGMVRGGTHPDLLQGAIWLWVVFGIGLLAMFLLPGLGLGWFTVLALLLAVAAIAMIVTRRTLVSATALLLALLLVTAGLRAGNII